MSSLEDIRATDAEEVNEYVLLEAKLSALEVNHSRDDRVNIMSLSAQERRDYAEAMIKDYREPIRQINEWTVSMLSVYDAAIYGLEQNTETSSFEDIDRVEDDYEPLHEPPGEYAYKLGLDEELGEDIWAIMIKYGSGKETARHEDDAAYRELITWDWFQRVMSLVAVRNGALAAHIGYYKSQADMDIQNVPQEYKVLETCWQQARIEGTNQGFPVFILQIMGRIIDNARAVQRTVRLTGRE